MELAKTPTVLIVDDEPSSIAVLNEVLCKDYEVLFATGGREALEIANSQLPDIILLDIAMSDLNGHEVCARLQADARTKKIPVIFVTAMTHIEDEVKGLETGAIDYITKPIRPQVVQARVRNHLEIKKYRDFLENLSTTDSLTGINNRRLLDESLEREWKRAIREGNSISYLLIDVDFFKSFNDHYGHPAGDSCLKEIAHGMAQCLRRPADLVARYGGDEFACLLPNTDLQGAFFVANRLISKIDEMHIPQAFSPIDDHVTISVGGASQSPQLNDQFISMVQNADKRLYEAKQTGRNKIVITEF